MSDVSPWVPRPASEPPPPPPSAASSTAAERSGPRGDRTHTVSVRLTPEELERWKAAMGDAGRGQMGRWVRETVTASLDGRREPRRIEGAGELRAELSKIGNNLNQVARVLNAEALGGPAVDRDELGRVLRNLAAAMGQSRDHIHEATR